MAVSVDGRIASHPHETDHERRTLGFTNDDDRAHLQGLLLDADAVVCGSSSLMASGGAWELANRKGRYPIWAILTNKGLPDSARFFTQRRIVRWLVSRTPLAATHSESSVRNVVYGAGSVARVLATELQAAGAERVILFGGGEVNRLFYEEDLVDELIVTVCPLILGSPSALPLVQPPLTGPRALTLKASQAIGDLVFLHYNVVKN